MQAATPRLLYQTWAIERDFRYSTAFARSQQAGAIDDLAAAIGLNAWESAQWLRSAAAPAVAIPNTILMLWLGDAGALGKWDVQWHANRCYLEDRGFQVVVVDRVKAGPLEALQRQILDEIGQLSGAAALHGLFITGHGSPGGFGTRKGGITYASCYDALAYHLALVVINACNGGWSHEDAGDNPVADGSGGKDLVSRSPCRVFYGKKGLLIPQVRPFRFHTRHAWDLLKPGAQGSQPGEPAA